MNSNPIIRVLMCTTIIAGSGAILQSCIFDPGARTLFASEEPAVNKQSTVKRTPTVKKVAAPRNETAFGRSGNNSGSGSSASNSSGMGGSSSSDSGDSGGGPSGGWDGSDRRLKTEIRRIGTSPSGIPVYIFRYVWGGPLFIGTMAQDLLLIRPEAVMQTASGYYMVNYAKLDIKMMSIDDGISLATSESRDAAIALSVDAGNRRQQRKSVTSQGTVLPVI